MSNLATLTVCVVLAVALEAVAHLLTPPQVPFLPRYISGISIILAGMMAYGWITGDWWPAIVLATFAAATGCAVMLLYLRKAWHEILALLRTARLERDAARRQRDELLQEAKRDENNPY